MGSYLEKTRRIEAELKRKQAEPAAAEEAGSGTAIRRKPDPFVGWRERIRDLQSACDVVGDMHRYAVHQGRAWSNDEWNERRDLLLRLDRAVNAEIERRGQTWRDYGWEWSDYGDWRRVGANDRRGG